MIELGGEKALLLLRPYALGDVSQNNGIEPFPRDVELGYRGLSGELLTILAPRNHFLALAHAASDIGTRGEALDVLLACTERNLSGIRIPMGRPSISPCE